LSSWPAAAVAQSGCGDGVRVVGHLTISGNSATSRETVLGALPRSPPAPYSAAELSDFDRRLRNLGIFDDVRVECRGNGLHVAVREKWTLVPELDFATGQTLADTYALLGATEYNLFGSANQLTLSAYREQRGFGFSAFFAEHRYRRRRWAFSAELSFGTAQLRFEDGGQWRTTSTALELTLRSPPLFSPHFNYALGAIISRESVHAAQNAVPPPTTHLIQPYLGFLWDAYRWHDLVPSGLRAETWLTYGGLFGPDPPLPRYTIESTLEAAAALGSFTALVSRVSGAIGTRGNVNYNFLVGSLDGVRGLRDAYYFNWAQVFSNLELRHSLQLGARWALQGVSFVDAALFERMNDVGRRGAAQAALSVGVGVRVVPTWISNFVLRLDGARLLAPEQAWFQQIGLTQYF
jgi:hypothetical protein